MKPQRVSGGAGRPNVKWSPQLLTRDFTLVWWGQMVSQVGDGVSKLALLWFVYSITGSPLKTTMIGLLQTLPPILFGPFIGVVVDRVPKKLLLIISDLIRAVVLGVIPCLIPVEAFSIERLYLMVFVHAVASAVFGPALTAAIPSLVSRHEFTAANALLQTTTSIGIILGPALSGVGIATMSSQEVLCVNAVSYVVSAACFLFIRFPRAESIVMREASSGRDVSRCHRGLSLCASAAADHSDVDRGRLDVYLCDERIQHAVSRIREETVGSWSYRGRIPLVRIRCRALIGVAGSGVPVGLDASSAHSVDGALEFHQRSGIDWA